MHVSGPPFLLVWCPCTPLWCCSSSSSKSNSRSSSNNSSMRRRRRRRSRSSSSRRSRSERRKTVGPNPGAILMLQSTESDGIFTVLSTISTRFNKCRNLSINRTSRGPCKYIYIVGLKFRMQRCFPKSI